MSDFVPTHADVRRSVVDLGYLDLHPLGAAVLLVAPSGVRYRHQCGGNACLQNEAEGALVPLPQYDLSEEPEAREVQNRVGLDLVYAAAVARMCERLGVPFRPSYEPADLVRSCEAWVVGRVLVSGPGSPLPPGLDGTEAILLWDNSD